MHPRLCKVERRHGLIERAGRVVEQMAGGKVQAGMNGEGFHVPAGQTGSEPLQGLYHGLARRVAG